MPLFFFATVELWGFRFAGEVLAEVAAKTLTAVPPTYETIMALDRKVRDFPLWHAAGGDGAANGDEKEMAGTMEHTVGKHIKQVGEWLDLVSTTVAILTRVWLDSQCCCGYTVRSSRRPSWTTP